MTIFDNRLSRKELSSLDLFVNLRPSSLPFHKYKLNDPKPKAEYVFPYIFIERRPFQPNKCNNIYQNLLIHPRIKQKKLPFIDILMH